MTNQNTPASRYYVMNLLSNLNSNFAPKDESCLQTNINRIGDCLGKGPISDFVGKWQVIWGPAIANSSAQPMGRWSKRHITDHAMYIAQSANKKEYFIGISGTNGLSIKNWRDEDINVGKMVAWPPKAVTGETGYDCLVSEGAYEGFDALWNLKDTTKPGSPTVVEFLAKALSDKGSMLTVGGHSLGGCLTPLLASALALKLDKSLVKIQAYPTAGPTPGNAAFADHLADVLHKYHAVYNDNDLVPQAWDFNELKNLTNDYDQWKFLKENIVTGATLVDNWLDWAQHRAKPEYNHYQRMPSGEKENFVVERWVNQGILTTKEGPKPLKDAITGMRIVINDGQIRRTLDKIASKEKEGQIKVADGLQNFSRFFVQMGLQHVSAYSAANPIPGSRCPIELNDEVRGALKLCFQRKGFERQEAGKYWMLRHGRKLLYIIANIVWQWVKIRPDDLATLEATDEQLPVISSEELKWQKQFEEIMELDSEEAGDEALEALDIHLGLLPWNLNPFTL